MKTRLDFSLLYLDWLFVHEFSIPDLKMYLSDLTDKIHLCCPLQLINILFTVRPDFHIAIHRLAFHVEDYYWILDHFL